MSAASTKKSAAKKIPPAKPAPAKKAATAKTATGATITLKQIASGLAVDYEMPKKHAEAMLSDVVAVTARHLKKGDKIRLTGLGILQVRSRPTGMGRNPATGEAIKIKASKKIAFRPAKGTEGERLAQAGAGRWVDVGRPRRQPASTSKSGSTVSLSNEPAQGNLTVPAATSKAPTSQAHTAITTKQIAADIAARHGLAKRQSMQLLLRQR